MEHPVIKGEWMPVDNSRNTLEVAPTDRDNVLAIRDTYDPREVIFPTKQHILNLANAVQEGRLRNLTHT